MTRTGLRRSLPGILLLLLGAVPVAAALQSPSNQSPLEAVKARNQAVRAALDAAGDHPDAAAKEKLKEVINGLMDFTELSRRALGRYWAERSDQEKADFVRVFRQLVRNSSVKKLSVYRADSTVYQPPQVTDGAAVLTTTAYKGRKGAEIVYHLHKVGAEWKAFDVVIDGTSTVRTYRDSFYKEIAKTSYQDMYQKLVRRSEEAEP